VSLQLPGPLRRAKAQVRPKYRQLTSARRALPDFVIIGAQKAGTTSLMRYLQSHPDVIVEPGVGEVHYFDIRWEHGESHYRSFFPLQRTLDRHRDATLRTTLTGEKTPNYLFYPVAPERARATIPAAKLIAILRDPVERAASQHKMNVNMGVESLDLTDAIEAESARIEPSRRRIIAGDPPASGYDAIYYSYVSRGLYAEQLNAWLRHYAQEQLLVLRSEDLDHYPESTYAKALDFLELASHRPEFVRHNAARRPYDIPPDVKARLQERFREPNRQLAEEFGISW